MAAAGKVRIGFSKPYVADYACSGGTITYSNGMRLARGVEVALETNTSESDPFYADNTAAETEDGNFTDGTVTLTVDGLFQEVERSLMGLPTATDGWIDYDDRQSIPYKGVGYIEKYVSDNVESFCPVVLVKTAFNQLADSAATSEGKRNYKTQALTARVLRGDDDNHTWKKLGEEDFATEAEAEAAIKELFNIADNADEDDDP